MCDLEGALPRLKYLPPETETTLPLVTNNRQLGKFNLCYGIFICIHSHHTVKSPKSASEVVA